MHYKYKKLLNYLFLSLSFAIIFDVQPKPNSHIDTIALNELRIASDNAHSDTVLNIQNGNNRIMPCLVSNPPLRMHLQTIW